jgi:predicted component of type VI protein secretion system
MQIQVTLKDTRSKHEQHFAFDQSPVRIGRSPHNEIVLEETFVSGCHGVIRFDESGIFYFDLGSRNGSYMDGKRLQDKTSVHITQPTRIGIWLYELLITPNPQLISVNAGQPGGQNLEPRLTLPLDLSRLFSSSPSPILQAKDSLSSAMSAHHAATPLVSDAASPKIQSSSAPTPSAPGPDSKELTERLLRCLQILDAFSQGFINLKKGYEQFGTEIGVRPLRGNTFLHRARSSEDMLKYFLDPKTDLDSCTQDLTSIFKDMGIHDVALMEGITQGVRSMLQRLDQDAQKLKPGAGLWSNSSMKENWNRYLEEFSVLLNEDEALHQEIFGTEFARSYAGVALADEREFQSLPPRSYSRDLDKE